MPAVKIGNRVGCTNGIATTSAAVATNAPRRATGGSVNAGRDNLRVVSTPRSVAGEASSTAIRMKNGMAGGSPLKIGWSNVNTARVDTAPSTPTNKQPAYV